MRTGKLAGGMGTFRIDTSTAESLKKALSKKFVTRVGILGSKRDRMASSEKMLKSGRNIHVVSKTQKDGLTNAEIGLKHEKGSYSENIPRRSFLEVPLTQNIGKLDRAGKILTKEMKAMDAGMNPEDAFRKAHRDLGIVGEQIVNKAFQDSGPGWKPNSPMTIAIKGSDKPLIDTSQLRASIMSDVVERSS